MALKSTALILLTFELRRAMHQSLRILTRVRVFSAVGVAVILIGSSAHAQPSSTTQKKPKDQAEYELLNEVVKGLQTNNPTKSLADLDAWTRKYPVSDYGNERLYYYMDAYSKTTPPQAAKVADLGSQLVAQGLRTIFPDPQQGPPMALNVLYMLTVTVPTLPNPTAEQIALGQRAAHDLMDYYLPTFFASNKKPANTTDQAWSETRTQFETAAKKALIAISLIPGNQAMNKKPQDCATAEDHFRRGLILYPDSSVLAYQLAMALRCQQKESPNKIPQAVYEFERAAVVDPTLGGGADPQKIRDFADTAYVTVHGSTEGLDQLKRMVKNSPLPPSGFTIKTANQIAQERDAEFEKSNPQLALWMKIKAQLADTDGERFFNDHLKDAAVPQLKGTLLEGKPECGPKELLVTVPMPDAQKSPGAEITLKLDSAVTGRLEPNQEFQWKGVPSAFSKDPFMLTMDTEKAQIQGLRTTPCAAAAAW
jgi:hypothetical protein